MSLNSADIAAIADAIWAELRPTILLAIKRNLVVSDPATGKHTAYAADSATVQVQSDVFEDVAGSRPYSGQGVERRERMV